MGKYRVVLRTHCINTLGPARSALKLEVGYLPKACQPQPSFSAVDMVFRVIVYWEVLHNVQKRV